MKKNICFICALIFSCMIMTSFSPSLDGRAVVADDGVLPQGIFARTVGYLPGDNISVTNLTNKSTVDILVIGAIDPSEGVAILLSPEAAKLLGIEKGSNNVVKITKRSGQLDDAVSGTAVIAKGSDSRPQEQEAPAVPEEAAEKIAEAETPAEVIGTPDEQPPETSAAVTETPEVPEEAEKIVSDNPAEPVIEEEKPADPIQEAAEEKKPAEEDIYYPAEAVEKDSFADESSVERIEATAEPETEEPEPKVEEVPEAEKVREIEELPSESVPAEAESSAAPETIGAESVAEEKPEDFPVEIAAEPFKEDDLPEEAAASVPEETTVSDELQEIKEPAEESIAVEKIDDAVETAAEDEVPEAEQPAEEQPPVPADEKDFAEAVEPEDLAPVQSSEKNAAVVTPEPEVEESGEESYEPIIIVPVNPNPPEPEAAAPAEETPSVETEPAADSVPEKPAAVEKPAESAARYDYEKYTVSSLKELKSASYYVQIAVLADEKNIQEVFDKYIGKYPITLVPLASGKAKQVLIGPLSVDEYGAVLKRFKAYGYKDAFLRKIR